jgi:hypothetical protein
MPDLDKTVMTIVVIIAVAGWAVIQSLIWLFSHLHFTLS